MFVVLFLSLESATPALRAEGRANLQKVIDVAVRELLKGQEETGRWPYECIVQEEDEEEYLPLCNQVACTSIVAQTLLFAATGDKNAEAAVQRGVTFVLKHLDHPKMAAGKSKNFMDLRIWGQGFALEFLCHIRARRMVGKHAEEVAKWIPRLVRTLVEEELPHGGWSYANLGLQQSFVTAPIAQALLWARSQGEKVPDALLQRTRHALEQSRTKQGGFAYVDRASDEKLEPRPGDFAAGSAGRLAVGETTLLLLGGGSIDRVRSALHNFHKHWDKLEERRQKNGTHEGPYGVAPYYFYYGHRYAAQAIQMLPEKERAKERARLLMRILQTRDEDGSWNDREFERCRYYGTSMAILALLGDKVPPPKWKKGVKHLQ